MVLYFPNLGAERGDVTRAFPACRPQRTEVACADGQPAPSSPGERPVGKAALTGVLSVEGTSGDEMG